MADAVVMIETVETDESGNRQIAKRTRVSELLSDRRDDIEQAVNEAANVVSAAAENISDKNGWRVSKLEATFGIKLKADAGVILTRVGAEASFDVKIVVERT